MKRAFKVGAVVCGSVGFALFLAWAVTLSSGPTSAQLAFGQPPSFVEIAAAKGRLIFCDSFANREAMESVDQPRPISPDVVKDRRFSLPGFSFRRITFTRGQPIWSVSFSLLVPCVLMAVSAGFLWRRFRTSCRAASGNHVAPASTQTKRPRDDCDASTVDRAA